MRNLRFPRSGLLLLFLSTTLVLFAVVLASLAIASPSGVGTLQVSGSLNANVSALSFDTTPPIITGATSTTAKTRSRRGTRVHYSVTATDATDGAVVAKCLPKSGTLFRVGRTTVACTAEDRSANATKARFVV